MRPATSQLQALTSMIVSDGYIQGAEVYIDRNEDGVADAEEYLPDYTTDEFGQLILPDTVLNAPENVGKQIIIQGGINMDTGAFNEIELKAPVGYEVINPYPPWFQKLLKPVFLLKKQRQISTSF